MHPNDVITEQIHPCPQIYYVKKKNKKYMICNNCMSRHESINYIYQNSYYTDSVWTPVPYFLYEHDDPILCTKMVHPCYERNIKNILIIKKKLKKLGLQDIYELILKKNVEILRVSCDLESYYKNWFKRF
jgi:predicted molibdopterin-dependent oxidoreductase YjgC